MCDDRRSQEAGELESAVAVRCAHHGHLDVLIAQPSDTSGPFSFDRGPPFELEAEFAKEINRPSEVFDNDTYVVHPLERHFPVSKVSPSLTANVVNTRRFKRDRRRGPAKSPGEMQS